MASHLFAGDTKPAQLFEFEKITVPLVPKVVDTAVKALLEEPEWATKIEAASAEIGRLLANSVAPFLSQFRTISILYLSGLCTSEVT